MLIVLSIFTAELHQSNAKAVPTPNKASRPHGTPTGQQSRLGQEIGLTEDRRRLQLTEVQQDRAVWGYGQHEQQAAATTIPLATVAPSAITSEPSRTLQQPDHHLQVDPALSRAEAHQRSQPDNHRRVDHAPSSNNPSQSSQLDNHRWVGPAPSRDTVLQQVPRKVPHNPPQLPRKQFKGWTRLTAGRTKSADIEG